jgi:hypothetical protein
MNVEIRDNKLNGEVLGNNIKLISTPLAEVNMNRKQNFYIEK